MLSDITNNVTKCCMHAANSAAWRESVGWEGAGGGKGYGGGRSRHPHEGGGSLGLGQVLPSWGRTWAGAMSSLSGEHGEWGWLSPLRAPPGKHGMCPLDQSKGVLPLQVCPRHQTFLLWHCILGLVRERD